MVSLVGDGVGKGGKLASIPGKCDEVGEAAAAFAEFAAKRLGRVADYAPRGVDWLADAMKGWKNGEVIPESVLRRLSRRLNRNNASAIQNEWALEILEKTGDGAQFVRFKDGGAGLLLRPNATRYEIVHELKHYEH